MGTYCFCLRLQTLELTVCPKTAGGSGPTHRKSTQATRGMFVGLSWRTPTWSAVEGNLYSFGSSFDSIWHLQHAYVAENLRYKCGHWRSDWSQTRWSQRWSHDLRYSSDSSDTFSDSDNNSPLSVSVMARSWSTVGGTTCHWSCLDMIRKSTALTLKMDWSLVDPETKQPGSVNLFNSPQASTVW